MTSRIYFGSFSNNILNKLLHLLKNDIFTKLYPPSKGSLESLYIDVNDFEDLWRNDELRDYRMQCPQLSDNARYDTAGTKGRNKIDKISNVLGEDGELSLVVYPSKPY